MPKGIPNAKPVELDEDAELARMIAEEDAAKMAAKAEANRAAAAAEPKEAPAFEIMPPATAAAIEARKPKTVVIKLLRNYRPIGAYEVIGHDQPAILRKNAAGVMAEVTPAAFVKDEPAPPPTPGTGFANKVWAGTLIKLPVDEAKTVKKAGIGEYELAD